jgi:regulatory protein
MSEITGLAVSRSRREKRVNVFLDGEFAFSMLSEVALKEQLKVGQELAADRLKELAEADSFQKCLNAAFRYLAYRPRSESEVRQRLRRHGFEGDCIEKTLARLKEQGLVDDAAFARFWKDNRESFSPRSRRLTRLELQRKGLNNDIIEPIINEVDDSDAAYRAAVKKARHLSSADYQDFRRKLAEHLRRRGFGYDIARDTANKVWKEYGKTPVS